MSLYPNPKQTCLCIICHPPVQSPGSRKGGGCRVTFPPRLQSPMCPFSWYPSLTRGFSLTHHPSEHMGHNILENCRQGARRRRSLSLVSQEPRLIQHGITSVPCHLCLQGDFSHGPHPTGHPKALVAILLPPPSWPWLQFRSRRPA